MKLLIVYPHGLGDCILATPAIKAYKEQTGNFIGFAMLERFKSSQLFKHNPYISQLHYTKDAWNDFSNYKEGCVKVQEQCEHIKKQYNYDDIVFIKHSKTGNKIIDCCEILNVIPNSLKTEVYIGIDDYSKAQMIIENKPYGFIQTFTGVRRKDLPSGYGAKFLKECKNLNNFIEIGKTFKYDDFNINIQFALLEQAAGICVPDSVFYHAAHALNKDIDLAFFAKGPSVYKRVKHLESNSKEKVVYKL